MNNARRGRHFEEAAAAFLEKEGYEILEKNYRCNIGEIDLIAREGAALCFVEVKYRASDKYGLPQEAVNSRKIHKIRKTAEYYMQHLAYYQGNHCKSDDYREMLCRFDVVAILGSEFTLIRNAF